MIQLLRRIALPVSTACVALAVACAPGSAAAQEPRASDVKAGFLANFARFAEWPPEILPEGAPITVCVMGDEDVAGAIERLAMTRVATTRELKIRRLKADILLRPEGSTVRTCHILYASGMDPKRWPVLLDAIEGAPVFSVSDSDGFAERGGLAALYLESKRMRFAINVDTMRRSRIHLSASALSLARIVKDDPNGRDHAKHPAARQP
jgi:hypothetical protein